MLHAAATNARQRALPMASSLLPRAVATELAAAVAQRRPLQSPSRIGDHASHQSVRSMSSWGGSGKAQRRRYQVDPSLRQTAHHRPQVNGSAVPFHIKELHLAKAPLPSDDAPQLSPPREYESDLVVVLDMDECLIHSRFLAAGAPQASMEYAHQLLQRRTAQNGVGGAATAVDSFRFRLPQNGDLVHVHLRPGLREFLDKVTARFETHLFTAAKAVYANPVLDHIDPNRQLAGRWYRESCVFCPHRKAYIKNLSHFRPSLDRVVLVDNNPLSFLHQPENGILVSSFYDDPTDTTLDSVYRLLEELDERRADVRPVLEERFGLAAALAELTGGAGNSATVTATAAVAPAAAAAVA